MLRIPTPSNGNPSAQRALVAAEDDLTKLPYLGVLLKDRHDLENIAIQGF